MILKIILLLITVFSWFLLVRITLFNKAKVNENGIAAKTITSGVKLVAGITAVSLLIVTGILFINDSILFNEQEKVIQVDKQGNKLLPIGSVILLEDSTKEVMIIGYCQYEIGTNEIWDYAGCLYPEGYMGADKTFLFNSDQIKEISFLGKESAEQQEFADYASKILKDEREKMR
ncbi:DUF4176 domain-containing protein [Lachnoclostridium sp.]|uniref:DUF4176 domain-containing protein n=1 Tax=Lachnoclostridium sp. TaxID=2028282 RepID=UPI00289C8B6D|nr:DUF4176 domain-containing protein [Lachnoclostridium sp.]